MKPFIKIEFFLQIEEIIDETSEAIAFWLCWIACQVYGICTAIANWNLQRIGLELGTFDHFHERNFDQVGTFPDF